MIDLAAFRDTLAAEVAARVPAGAVNVYPRGVDGVFASPAVVFGQPSIEFDVQPCSIHAYTFGVAVAVERGGGDDNATQTILEETWPAVAAAIGAAIDTGALDAVCRHAKVARAEFGQLQVQGQGYPAQEIVLEIYG